MTNYKILRHHSIHMLKENNISYEFTKHISNSNVIYSFSIKIK